jgi:hypothetical protein
MGPSATLNSHPLPFTGVPFTCVVEREVAAAQNQPRDHQGAEVVAGIISHAEVVSERARGSSERTVSGSERVQ